MLRRADQDHALALTCADSGDSMELLHDARDFFRPGQSLTMDAVIHTSSQATFLHFLADVRATGHSMRGEIILNRDGREFSFSLFGVTKNGRICILAVQSPRQIFLVYDEFMAMINEQARSLREAQKKSAGRERISAEDRGLLDDYMKLNNELANMQRDLTIAHKNLQGQERRFRELVTFNPDAQVVVDAAGRILFFNPAAELLLGLNDKESIGSVFALNLHGEKEFCLHLAQGRVCMEVRHTAVSWASETATLYSLRDITERKQMEQLKEDVNRILQHDLISPLNPIITLPQLLMDNANITADQKRILEMLTKAGNRMLSMIRLSLNLYKMELGSFEFSPEPVNLLATFHDILGDLSERARSRRVLVRIFLGNRPAHPRDEFRTQAEPNLCYSMFSNLILNSIEASSPEEEVTIRLDTNGRAVVTIHNAGVVPAHIRDRFFEKYVTSGKPHGTGLGTYSAQLIARTLGGSIHMHSSDQDGTTVTVELPLPDRVQGEKTITAAPKDRSATNQASGLIRTNHPDPALADAMHALAAELAVHAYSALELAQNLSENCQPESAERLLLERIVADLKIFDYASARTTLTEFMNHQSPTQG
jgi:signal transduction histidine kinase